MITNNHNTTTSIEKMMKTKSHVKKSNKPFCKVCFDTGKSEHEYRSHYVKNVPGPNGVVVCPTILSVECRYCKSIGHTVSKCPSLKSKSSSSSHQDRKGHKHRENSHDTAANDVAEEEDKTMEIEIEPPPPPQPPPDNNKYEISYANIVSKQPTTITHMNPTTTTAVKAEKEKEKRTPMKLSIIDPSLLENTNNAQKSHTPLCSPPSHVVRMKPTTTIPKFKKKQIIIHRWADYVETDMSDYD